MLGENRGGNAELRKGLSLRAAPTRQNRRAAAGLAPGHSPGGAERAVWRGSGPSPLSGQRLARMRLRSGWRLLAAVGLGMLIAVLLSSSVPFYDDLVANIQIQATLNGQEPLTRNVEVRATTLRVSGATLQAQDTAMRPVAAHYCRSFTLPTPLHYLTAA